MSEDLHLVIGAAGATGQAVVKELQERQLAVVAVERSKTAAGIETIKADMLDAAQAEGAIKGATHVYLCVGITYNAKAWQAQWPQIMRNVIAACHNAGAKLIFFDNIYMYSAPLPVQFDETQPQATRTRKGIVRKEAADMLLEAHRAGAVKAVIGRSADFYGPDAVNSPFYIAFLQRMLTGKAPQAIGKLGVKHTYANSLDNGRALVRLALDESAYGQAWHLPVGEPVTIEEVVEIFNKVLHADFKPIALPRPLLNILSLFIPPLSEAKEMLYQFDDPYIMSFRKFREKYPDFRTTSYEEGIKEMVESFTEKVDQKGGILQ